MNRSTDQKIILVDDETIILESLQQWLEGEGFTVITANNGAEALQRCKFETIPVGVFDIRMPGMDGITLLKEVKKSCPSMAVVMMTAFASVEDAVTCITVGAFDYVIKPFPPEKLTHLIRHIFEIIELEERCRRLESQTAAVQKFIADHQYLLADEVEGVPVNPKEILDLRRNLRELMQALSQ